MINRKALRRYDFVSLLQISKNCIASLSDENRDESVPLETEEISVDMAEKLRSESGFKGGRVDYSI